MAQISLRKRTPTPAPCHSGRITRRHARIASRWCYAVRAYKVWTEGELMSGRTEGCYVMVARPPANVVNVIVEPEPQPLP